MTASRALPGVVASGRTRHSVGFWIIATAFTVVMAYSTVPTPLYGLYEQRDHFPRFLITVIFAAYAVGVVVSLYLAGHVSDWLGRRRVVLAAVAIEIVAAALFVCWPELPGLLVARFVNGVGVGILTATATAHLSELHLVAHPGRRPGAATTVAGVANLGGLGIGPLIGGAFAELLPDPLRLPHQVFLLLLAISAVAVAFVPETIERREIAPPYRPQRVSVPPASRGLFWAAATAGFAAFAVFGLFTSLAPTLLAVVLHEDDHLVVGAVSCSVFAAACVAQVVAASASVRTQLRSAMGILPVGLVLLAVGAVLEHEWLFVVGGIVAGAGVGLLFKAALAVGGGVASPEHRGEVLAALFLVAYAGLCVPVLLAGLALVVLPATGVLLVFAALVVGTVVVAALRMLRAV